MGRVDLNKLRKMIDEGKSAVECAAYFGVSKSAISQRLKSHGLRAKKAATKIIMSSDKADIYISKNLDTIDQLQKINKAANDVLDSAMPKKEGDFIDGQTALKAMAEIRNQLSLQLDLFQTLYDAQAGAEFQKEVLEAIGDIAPDVRARIVSRLQEKRAIRRSIQLN